MADRNKNISYGCKVGLITNHLSQTYRFYEYFLCF